MPFALEAIRKLGEAGRTVYGGDPFPQAPGSHSRYVREQFLVRSARHDTAAFVYSIAGLCTELGIDVLAPAFEEVLYLAAHAAWLPGAVRCFFPGFTVLRELHDKI